MQIKKQQLDLDTEQTHSELGKENVKTVTLLFNSYTAYIMRNAMLDEAQDGIKMAE